jgi:hypothetical protein
MRKNHIYPARPKAYHTQFVDLSSCGKKYDQFKLISLRVLKIYIAFWRQKHTLKGKLFLICHRPPPSQLQTQINKSQTGYIITKSTKASYHIQSKYLLYEYIYFRILCLKQHFGRNLQSANKRTFSAIYQASMRFVSFRSPYRFCLLTVGIEGVYLHFITLRHTPQSLGLLWTRDRSVAETST